MGPNVIDHLKTRIAELKEEIRARERILLSYEQTLQAELSDGKTMAVPEHKSGEANRSAFIRSLLQGPNGTTYQEIGKALDDAGIKTHPNYRYTVVNKWKVQERVEERDGRLYWVFSSANSK
jgi:hypothetical protein